MVVEVTYGPSGIVCKCDDFGKRISRGGDKQCDDGENSWQFYEEFVEKTVRGLAKGMGIDGRNLLVCDSSGMVPTRFFDEIGVGSRVLGVAGGNGDKNCEGRMDCSSDRGDSQGYCSTIDGRDEKSGGESCESRCSDSCDRRSGTVTDSVDVSEKTLRNRQWRKEKKEKKNRRKQVASDAKLSSSKSWIADRTTRNERSVLKESEMQKEEFELKQSSALKWKAQNELATEKARRELHVLRQNDVQGEIQRYRTKISAATERNMVSIEKTHGLLKASGNVPGFQGSVETVVDGEIVKSDGASRMMSGTISPDSSISQAEARKAQKDLLDSQNENAKLKEKLALITRKAGFSAEHFELYDKNTWTENDENEALLDELYPEGYVVNREYCAAGKFQLR